jgi:hypothetical protein
MRCASQTPKTARELGCDISERFLAARFTPPQEGQGNERIEMRSGDGAEYQDQDHQHGTGGNGVA